MKKRINLGCLLEKFLYPCRLGQSNLGKKKGFWVHRNDYKIRFGEMPKCFSFTRRRSLKSFGMANRTHQTSGAAVLVYIFLRPSVLAYEKQAAHLFPPPLTSKPRAALRPAGGSAWQPFELTPAFSVRDRDGEGEWQRDWE